MSHSPIKVSKPVDLGVKRSEVDEFTPAYQDSGPLGKKVDRRAPQIIFLNRGNREKLDADSGKLSIWKSEDQREKVYARIAEAERGNLKQRTVIEIIDVSDAEYTYKYRTGDQLVRKTVQASAPEGVPGQTKVVSEASKTHELTLRQFKQDDLSHPIIEGIKATLAFLATPFAAFYRLVAGKETHSFADMLAPIQHDRVGELTHDRVLNQLHFVGKFLRASDPQLHRSADYNVTPATVKMLRVKGNDYECRPSLDKNGKACYEIWMDTKVPGHWITATYPTLSILGRRGTTLNVREKDGDYKEYQYRNFVDNRDGTSTCQIQIMQQKGWTKVAPSSRATIHNDEICFYDQDYDYRHGEKYYIVDRDPMRNGRNEPPVRRVAEVQYADILGTDHTPYDVTQSDVKKAHQAPVVESAVQRAAVLFEEGFILGKQVHDALNSGSKKVTDATAANLARRLRAFESDDIKKTVQHLIVPIGQGEGKNYVPHFLVFVQLPEITSEQGRVIQQRKLVMKHIQFSSTSMNEDQIEAVTSYDMTAGLDSDAKKIKFFRALIKHHPYSRPKDSEEVNTKGPMQKDGSFESLLVTFGKKIAQTDPQKSRTSRDPVKAMFTILKELGLQESSISQLDSKLPEVASSKAKFYKFYVDHLIRYYEDNEGKLNGDERARSLDGMLFYANQVKHYMEKELGVDAALAISEYLVSFVEKKLEELKRTEAHEQTDLKNLDSKISKFSASLQDSIENTMTIRRKTKAVEGSRIRVDESIAIETLMLRMQRASTDKAYREESLLRMNQLLSRLDHYLENNEPRAAKVLALGIMQALPTSKLPVAKVPDRTVWDLVDAEEINGWNEALDRLAERMFEASARSCTFPLLPHEVFEFHVVLPMLQRHLLTRKIPLKVNEFDGLWAAFKVNDATASAVEEKSNADLVAEVAAKLDEFIAMREKQIEEEVTKRLKARWKEQDEEEARKLSEYRSEYRGYLADKLAYETEQLFPSTDPYHVPMRMPTEPVKPATEDSRIKKERRERELAEEITIAKDNDPFLNELKAVKAAGIPNLNWDARMQGSARLRSVMGCFARIVGISKDLIAYKMGGDNWVAETFKDNNAAVNEEIWLMRDDLSTFIGRSVYYEKRYQACERAFEGFQKDGEVNEDVSLDLIVGYDGLGDGTTLTGDLDALNALRDTVQRAQGGFFNSRKGEQYLAPEEVAHCRKVLEMRKILAHPSTHLRPHSTGMLGSLKNMFGNTDLTVEALQKKFSEMSRIFFVASKDGARGCFTLSESQSAPGGLATSANSESAPKVDDRNNWIGQATPEMLKASVGGDRERQEFNEIVNHSRLFTTSGLDAGEEFVLRESALSQAQARPGRGYHNREFPLSYLAISQCLQFIYQMPEKLAKPAVQHTLYKTLLQHDLIREHLMKNPDYFINEGPILEEVCKFLQTKPEHRGSELFLREICQRIRRHAMSLSDDLKRVYGEDKAAQISGALPAYDQTKVADACMALMIDREDQKEFATFALSYYYMKFEDGIDPKNPKVFPDTSDVAEWTKVLNALFIMNKSPIEVGHSGWQAELLYQAQRFLLPKIGEAVTKDVALRKELLFQLTGRKGDWDVDESKEYAFTIPDGDRTFTVDLRTGEGFRTQPKTGKRCKMPSQITQDEQFRFVFGVIDPTVESDSGHDGITEFAWKDEADNAEYKFIYDSVRKTYQMFQVVRGHTYLFQRIKLDTRATTKLWQLFARHNNRTVEDMIEKKGAWIPLLADGTPDLTRARVAQYGKRSLEKDPITLSLSGDKIKEASLGEGDERMIICSGLSDRDAKLISCRDGTGLLLLSKDGKHVHEIRFPTDEGNREQLILKKSSKDPSVWVVSGREDWEWQLTNTRNLETRFGKNYRDYILALKNSKTGEEEFWVFPHMVTGGTKKGEQIKFLRSAVDFIDALGGTISAMGLPEGIDVETLRMAVGTVENFAGGAANILEGAEAIGGQVQGIPGMDGGGGNASQVLDILKGMVTPRAIRYRIGRRSEDSSHAGFFYLAYVASKRGDWGAASRYLQLMIDNGQSNPSDIKQLQKMILTLFGIDALASKMRGNLTEMGPEEIKKFMSILEAKSPLEAAFRAKLLAQFVSLQTTMQARYGVNLFDSGTSVEAGQVEKIIKIAGASYYVQYRNSLSASYQSLNEYGLLLSKPEETLLTQNSENLMRAISIPLALQKAEDAAAAEAEREGRPLKSSDATPVQLALPNKAQVDAMIVAMADVVNPTGVWSIHSMHQEKGTYPKWETVLSNFWSYWGWISQEALNVEDIAFLLREVPRTEKLHEQIDTARRMLLLHWHKTKRGEFKEDREQEHVATDALYREVKFKARDVADLGGIKEKAARLKHEAAMSPGLMRAGYSFGYGKYLDFRKWFSDLTYQTEVGGVQRTEGSKHLFTIAAKNLLQTYLMHSMETYQGNLITFDGIEPRRRVRQEPRVPTPPKQNPLKQIAIQELDRACEDILGESILRSGAGQVQEVMAMFEGLFDLSSEAAWKTFLFLISQGRPLPVEVQDQLGVFKSRFESIFANYSKSIGRPEKIYPKHVEHGAYEDVEVRLPNKSGKTDWTPFFTSSCKTWNTTTNSWQDRESVWEDRAHTALKYYADKPGQGANAAAKLKKIRDGIIQAKDDLIDRTKNSFDVTQLRPVYREITLRLQGLRTGEKQGKGNILDFARSHAAELGIMQLFADRNLFTDEQIIDKVLDLYRYGQLGRLDDLELQKYFAELITETILITTERQQYEKAQKTCLDLSAVLKGIVADLPTASGTDLPQKMAQSMANRSVDWILYSTDLHRFLTEGANRLRYAETRDDGKHYLKDQKFTRRYLVSDFRNHWICRTRATSALEDMMNDLRTQPDGNGKPVRFIRAKMGTGKSDFVFPEAIDLFLQSGYRPVMITTDELVGQLSESMGHKAYLFQFDINFGLTDKASPQEIERHLTLLLDTLKSLDEQGKAVITSPSQMGGLRDKRVHLQDELKNFKEDDLGKRNDLFKQLQLVKKIEAHLKAEQVRYLVDEDVNYDNSYEYNYAIGDFRTVDTIRFNVAEHLVFLMAGSPKYNPPSTTPGHKDSLWQKFVRNDLRSIDDITGAFRPVIEDLYEDTNFWVGTGWSPEVWKSIPKKEFVDYILGLRAELPTNMGTWDKDLPIELQQHRAHVAALKTYLSRTFKSVFDVNPKLERGCAKSNGVTVVPYTDGVEKEGVLFGEESENIWHHVCNAVGCGNLISEDLFVEKEKDLGGLDIPISSARPGTWSEWAGRIAHIKMTKNYNSKYEAFINDPELALQRFQLLRHIMLETPEIRVYLEQITYNSQDLGPGRDVRVGSGTGNPEALNLADYLDPERVNRKADVVLGETLLCLDLDLSTKENTFDNPLEFVKKKVADPKCHAIMNYDYSILGGNSERLAAILRQGKDRQIIYRDLSREKKMWYSGDQYFPMKFEPGAIQPDKAKFYYGPGDSRGVDMPIPRGGGKEGIAMVGMANKEDPVAQLLWRMRYLDLGHKVLLAHNKTLENHLRKFYNLTDTQEVTQGHVWAYFTSVTLEEEEVKHVKAVIFKAQTPAKRYIDPVVGKAYDTTDVTNTQLLEEFEGRVVFNESRHMYVMNSTIDWEREYAPQSMTNPIEFMLQLYAAEKRKVEGMKEAFVRSLQRFIKERARVLETVIDAQLLKWVDSCVTMSLTHKDKYDFEQALKRKLAEYQRILPPDQIALVREILRKTFEMKRAFEKTNKSIEKEMVRVSTDEQYKLYLREILPAAIPADPVAGQNNQQRVQQLQQQQQQQRQEKMERVFQPVRSSTPTRPLDYAHFMSVVTGQEQIQKNQGYGTSYSFETNGNFLPLDIAVRQFGGAYGHGRGPVLPEDLFGSVNSKKNKNIYISHRAWELLRCIAQNGLPVVEVMVAQVDGKSYSVIVTPAEREESLAATLITERQRVREAKIAAKGAPAPAAPVIDPSVRPYSEDNAWDDATAAFIALAPGIKAGLTGLASFAPLSMVEDKIRDGLSGQKASLMHYLRPFLASPNANQAWAAIQAQFPLALQAMGPDTAGYIGPHIASLERPLKEIHKKFRASVAAGHTIIAAAPVAARPRQAIDRVAIYALSNENFSAMVMDRVEKPKEEDLNFIMQMVLNKIYLNWMQFTLPELDCLISLVDGMSRRDFDSFVDQIEAAHSAPMKQYLITVRERKYTLKDQWMMKFLQRKLDSDYDVFPSPGEKDLLRAWVETSKPFVIQGKIEFLKRRQCYKSVKVITDLKNAFEERRRADASKR